jgi:hypothetical protein
MHLVLVELNNITYSDWAMGWLIQGSIPGKGSIFFLFSKMPRLASGPTTTATRPTNINYYITISTVIVPIKCMQVY